MPPDSWNGYPRIRSSGEGMPTERSSSTAVAVGLLAVHVQVEPERLGDLPADPLDRVERGHRVLEDHAQLRAPDLAELLGRHGGQVVAGEVHGAAA